MIGLVPFTVTAQTACTKASRSANEARQWPAPLDRLISHRLPLAEVNEAIDLMLSGEALRVVLDTTTEGAS